MSAGFFVFNKKHDEPGRLMGVNKSKTARIANWKLFVLKKRIQRIRKKIKEG